MFVTPDRRTVFDIHFTETVTDVHRNCIFFVLPKKMGQGLALDLSFLKKTKIPLQTCISEQQSLGDLPSTYRLHKADIK